jgi:hypothetical protein
MYTTGLYEQRGPRGQRVPKVAARLASFGTLAGVCQGSLPHLVTRHVTTRAPTSPPRPVVRPLSIPET